jgi:hypothetical protein
LLKQEFIGDKESRQENMTKQQQKKLKLFSLASDPQNSRVTQWTLLKLWALWKIRKQNGKQTICFGK